MTMLLSYESYFAGGHSFQSRRTFCLLFGRDSFMSTSKRRPRGRPRKADQHSDSIAILESFSGVQWAEWLERRLHLFYSPTNTYSQFAFKFPDLGITDADSILDALTQLLDSLSPAARDYFKDGLSELLRRWRDCDQPTDALADILSLVALFQASNAIPILVDKAFANEIDVARLYDLVAVLKGSCDQRISLEESRRLVRLQGLPDAWVVDLWEAALFAAPRTWAHLLIEFSERLDHCAATYESAGLECDVLARRIWQACKDVVQDIDLLDSIATIKTNEESSKVLYGVGEMIIDDSDTRYLARWQQAPNRDILCVLPAVLHDKTIISALIDAEYRRPND